MRPVNNYLFVEEVETKLTQKEMREAPNTAVLYTPPEKNPNVREYKVIASGNLKAFPLGVHVLAQVKDVINVHGTLAVHEESIIGVNENA